MKLLFVLVLVVALAVFAAPVAAQDSPLPTSTPPGIAVTPTPEPGYPVPDWPPGFGGEDFDIVEWLGSLSSGVLMGAFVAWFLEKTRLSKYIDPLPPEVKRNVTLAIAGLFGAAAAALLMLILELPEGSVAVINATIALLTSSVTSQVAHGRMALHGERNKATAVK